MPQGTSPGPQASPHPGSAFTSNHDMGTAQVRGSRPPDRCKPPERHRAGASGPSTQPRRAICTQRRAGTRVRRETVKLAPALWIKGHREWVGAWTGGPPSKPESEPRTQRSSRPPFPLHLKTRESEFQDSRGAEGIATQPPSEPFLGVGGVGSETAGWGGTLEKGREPRGKSKPLSKQRAPLAPHVGHGKSPGPAESITPTPVQS